MPKLRSTRWILAVAPALFLSSGCGNNESDINFKNTTTSPDAATSPEDAAKRAAEAPKKREVPAGYPRPSR